jgi:thiosulfate reductase cytochrome b subunit
MTIMHRKSLVLTTLVGVALIVAGIVLLIPQVQAQDEVAPAQSPLHPTFQLLDAAGNNVLETGQPVSTMNTCGTCHDTAFIAEHSLHADVGAGFDSTQLVWEQTSSGSEMNCFMCHLNQPNNDARSEALASGNAIWAATATLSNSDMVTGSGTEWTWNTAAFNTDGTLRPEYITISEPKDANCGQCHGVVQGDLSTPFTFDPLADNQWQTFTTGQVYAPQRISNSGMNMEGKIDHSRTWDVHAERVVNCVDCHHALNNPVFSVETGNSRPEHLLFEPRRLEFDEYLQQPLHIFANTDVDSQFAAAGRTCTSCHDAVSTHTWLPYAERHTQVLACETCHIPEMNAAALSFADWTVLDASGEAILGYRGVDLNSNPPLLTGYQPALLTNEDDLIAPYNLVTVWYWQFEGEPVPLEILQAAYFDGDDYAPAVIATFDANNSGLLDEAELNIDTAEKQTVIAERLAELGYADAAIVGEVQPYEIHHGVTHGEWAISDCATCHSEDSRLNVALDMGNRSPGNALPIYSDTNDVQFNGELALKEGVLYYAPLVADNIYVLGKDSVSWIDWFGVFLFLGTLLGVTVHGGLRYVGARRSPVPHDPKLREVYMYTIYERQWHWLQTVVIFGLIFTGLVIHKPQMFGMFSFRYIVLVHNALALIMVVNAALAAFYHLASGEIRQFLPEPHGFFGKMFAQARYYLWGIFHNEPHPFEKTPQQKMNPIQQLTYFGLLNVLLPLQVITGVLMWGAQRFPESTTQLGGLPFLAPFHSLIAWSLATFIVLHVYMTTTGHTPLANIQAMIMGWDEVEVHETSEGTDK